MGAVLGDPYPKPTNLLKKAREQVFQKCQVDKFQKV